MVTIHSSLVFSAWNLLAHRVFVRLALRIRAVPLSATATTFTVAGIVKSKDTAAEAPGATLPRAIGSVGPEKVTLPAPLNRRGTTLLIIILLAASVPVFVTWSDSVIVFPEVDWTVAAPLRLGGPPHFALA